ncbi:MAG: MltA domain-containing protein [Azovibrio sp.]|nr:MltA domain-containing protein [Azovibrio sp.]
MLRRLRRYTRLTPLCCFLLTACATPLPWLSGGDSQAGAAPRDEAAAAAAPACPACPVCPPAPACPQAAPVVEAPPRLEAATWADLPDWQKDTLVASWPAWQESCRGLASRANAAAWVRVCSLAREVDGQDEAAVRRFYEAHFIPHAVVEADGRREGMITGYYEPLIRGSRQRDARYATPVLGVPADMLSIELGDVYPDLKHRRLRGRLEGNKVLPYWSRAEIEARRGQHWPGKVLLWVEDPIEFFFLQIQGSGRVQLPDGSRVRIGYADQNGHPYQSIGRLLVERGALKLEEASMQGIQAWARAHPGQVQALLNSNPSYVFFRELPNAEGGPIGALGVPLTPERSLAVDPRYIPLGAPVWLATTRPNSSQPLHRLMLAQDTGGAIKGGVRADFFWGFGKEAGELAGRMKQKGRLWVLLPAELAPR